jgi:hypothetical protein
MDKPVGDRVKESVHLLNQLRELGVGEMTPSLTVLKGHLNDWIKTGDPWAGSVEFPSYGRVAKVVLPRRSDRAATIQFLIVK